ncbi:MAG: hypothetical protein ACREE6_08470 [Limisphaerales bacterium]
MHNKTTTTTNPTNNQSQPLLKIAMDVHLAWYVIALQEEGSSPKPPQRFKPADFLIWIKSKVAVGYRVTTCYEAGPFGFTLHRQLIAMGITNHVIRPRNWDGRTDESQDNLLCTGVGRAMSTPETCGTTRLKSQP